MGNCLGSSNLTPEELERRKKNKLIDSQMKAQSNKEAMQILAHTGKSYRYDRLDTETRHGGYLDQDDIDLFNESMERNQHVRLKKVVESEGSDE